MIIVTSTQCAPDPLQPGMRRTKIVRNGNQFTATYKYEPCDHTRFGLGRGPKMWRPSGLDPRYERCEVCGELRRKGGDAA